MWNGERGLSIQSFEIYVLISYLQVVNAQYFNAVLLSRIMDCDAAYHDNIHQRADGDDKEKKSIDP